MNRNYPTQQRESLSSRGACTCARLYMYTKAHVAPIGRADRRLAAHRAMLPGRLLPDGVAPLYLAPELVEVSCSFHQKLGLARVDR